jgi:hypothetical protein
VPADSVSPFHCALLLGIPLDRSSFERAAASDSEFLSINSLKNYSQYDSLAKAMRRFADDCNRLGCAVVRDATIQDLRREARRRRVVCLLAHCEYPPLTVSDVLDEQDFRNRILHGAGPECEMLRAALSGGERLCEVVDTANSLIHLSHTDLAASRVNNTSQGRVFGADGNTKLGLFRIGRRKLEDFFGNKTIREAPAVELLGRKHTTGEVIASIPERSHLLLNLSLCRSIELGESIHRWRPLVRCLVDRQLLDPIVAMLRFKQQLIQLANAKREGQLISYPEAVSRSQDVFLES